MDDPSKPVEDPSFDVEVTVTFSFDLTELVDDQNAERLANGRPPMTEDEMRELITEHLQDFDFNGCPTDPEITLVPRGRPKLGDIVDVAPDGELIENGFRGRVTAIQEDGNIGVRNAYGYTYGVDPASVTPWRQPEVGDTVEVDAEGEFPAHVRGEVVGLDKPGLISVRGGDGGVFDAEPWQVKVVTGGED